MGDQFQPQLYPSSSRVIPVLEVRPVEEPLVPQPARLAGNVVEWAVRLPARVVRAIGSVLEWLFGAAVLMVGLAVLAALPVLQFLSLGYLLEAGARVARSGRLRDGFIGVR